MRRTNIAELAVILFFSLTPLLWLGGGQIVLGHDANYRLNLADRIVTSMFSWSDTAFYGTDWTYDRGYLPVNLVQLLLLKVTPSFSAMQTVFFVLLFLTLGFSMYACLFGIFPETKYRTMRIVSPLFAMYNFFILQGWFTADTGRIFVFAGLPLYFLVIHKLFTGSWSFFRSLVVFGALSFFFNGNGLPPLAGFEVIAIAIISACYAAVKIRSAGWQGAVFSVKSAVALLFIFIAMNAYWILPVANFTTANYATDVSASGGPEGVLAWERMISQYASFTNLFRLQGIPDWYNNANHAYADPYIRNAFLILLSFFPAVVVLAGLARGSIRKLPEMQRRFLMTVLLVLLFGLFMSAGTHPPFGKIYELFLRYVPGFVIFRSSLYKFGFALWIPMIILFGYFINEGIVRLRHKRIAANGLLLIVIAWVIGFQYPYFFPEKVFRFVPPFTTRFMLPQYVTEMTSYIDAAVPPASRILLLPELDREYIGIPVDAYRWGYYSLIMLPNFISNRTYIADRESDNIIQMMYRSIYAGDTETFSRLAKKVGVTYILFRSDVAFSPGALSVHSIEDVRKNIASLSDVSVEKRFGDWTLYKVTDSQGASPVAVVPSFDYLSSPVYNSSYLLAREGGDAFVRTFSDSMTKTLRPESRNFIIEAECFLCKKDAYQALVKSINLPKPSAIPGVFRNAEKRFAAMLAGALGPKEKIDADLAVSEFRLSELRGGQSGLRQQQYLDTLNDAIANYRQLTGRDKNYYAIRIAAYLESQLGAAPAGQPFLKETLRNIKGETWMTQDVTRPRFGFTITEPGDYSFYIPDKTLYRDTMVLDGSYVSTLGQRTLSTGFHTVELSRINDDFQIFNGPPALFLTRRVGDYKVSPPAISYEKQTPTRYVVRVTGATGPYILELNQKFDARWKASVARDDRHVEVDSYANGWYIDKPGDYDVVLTYAPQKTFYIGMIVSGIAILTEFIMIGIVVKKRIE